MVRTAVDATDVFREEDRDRIELAVAEIEERTSVEIVCAVASESGRYDRADALVGLGGSLLALSLAHALHLWLTTGSGTWTTSALHLGWQAGAVVVGFLVGMLLSSRVPWLRRLLVREAGMEEAVRDAAARVFASASVGDTLGATGLLVYVSLFERRVAILVDEAVENALGEGEIGRLRHLALQELKGGRFAEAFLAVMHEAAPRLAEALPAQRQLDPNELPDHLLVIHPRPSSSIRTLG